MAQRKRNNRKTGPAKAVPRKATAAEPSERTTPAAAKPATAKKARPRKPPPRKKQGLSTNTKVTLAVVAVLLGILGYVVVAGREEDKAPAAVEAASPLLAREDSHRLDVAADGKVTLVEFLDFECESCGAAFPHVERLRDEYQGRITYVVRYFPLPNHSNAMNAALAAEAAAKQGKFEGMYTKLFETQKEWGEARESHAERFAGYAKDLGLDLDRYRADVAAPETTERIKRDQQDGKDLGVTGTPTFFLNGERLRSAPTYAALKAAIDGALAE